jgi:hypothetical protein
MKTVTLHIGQTKTATTSQQAFLSLNRQRLAEAGLLYPEPPPTHPNRHQHRFLVDCLQGDPAGRDAAWQFLIDQIASSPQPQVLISEEVFWHLGERDAARRTELLHLIRHYLAGYEVRILVYLRRQDHWIESWHNQIVKTDVRPMSRLALDDFVAAHERMGLLDYEQVLSSWADVFGAAAITVREFRADLLLQGDPVADLLWAVSGLDDLSTFESAPRLQGALSPAATEMARRFNQCAGAARHKAAHMKLLEVADPLLAGRGSRLSVHTANRLLERYGPSNEAVARRWQPVRHLFDDWLPQTGSHASGLLDPYDMALVMAQTFIRQEDRLAQLQRRILALEQRLGQGEAPPPDDGH